MVSAPRSRGAWLTFVGSLVGLYAAITFFLTDAGPFESVALGVFYGCAMAIAIASLVVVWRGVPGLLYPDEYEK